jgi:predicted PurR-regulated permease PerM
VQAALILLGVAAGLWVLYRIERVVLLLIVTTFFAYLVAPLVRFAEQPIAIRGTERSLPRGLAIGVVYLFILGVGCAGVAILLPRATQQIGAAVAQAPEYAASLRAWEQGWAGYYAQSNLPVEVQERIERSVLSTGDAAIEFARGSLMTLAGGLAYLPWLVLVPILAFFLLKDARSFRRAALIALPHRVRLSTRRLLDELNTVVAAYVRAQLLASVLIGSICGTAFALLGVPYAILLGVCAGVLELIPLIGPLVVAVMVVVVAAFHSPMVAWRAAGFLAVLRVVHDYVIYPRLVGPGLHLHPLAVVVAVFVGVELDGIVGLFMAVPTVAIASVVYRHWLETARRRRSVLAACAIEHTRRRARDLPS